MCLLAVFAMAGVQSVHMHPASMTLNGTLDTHCSLCMVSHCVLSPQHAYVLSLPARVLLHSGTAQITAVYSTRIFDRFVRPPPAA